MSSARNHAKRSHRSHFRSRAFQTGRVSVIKPTLPRKRQLNLLRLLRRARQKRPETVVGEPMEE